MRIAEIKWTAALAGMALLSGPLFGGGIAGKVTVAGARDSSDAVVYIASAPGSFSPGKGVRLEQLGIRFDPHVLPVVVGTTVDFLNGDDVQHNVFTPSPAGDFFNLGSWPKGQVRSFTFKKPGKVDLFCNVHNEMRAFILVLQNPFFAVTDKAGNFHIDNIPAGNYQLKVWHEHAKGEPKSIQVSTGNVSANFALSVR